VMDRWEVFLVAVALGGLFALLHMLLC
jgi:hypothetical protein